MNMPDSLVLSRIDHILFPVTSRKASIAISAAIIALLSLILFSVRQNILTYDNTSETVYFVLTVVIAYGIGSWLLLGYVKQTTRTTTTTTNAAAPAEGKENRAKSRTSNKYSKNNIDG